jgi:hypothetical protein
MNLASEAVQGPSLALQCIDHIQGCDRLTTSMLSIGHSPGCDIFNTNKMNEWSSKIYLVSCWMMIPCHGIMNISVFGEVVCLKHNTI